MLVPLAVAVPWLAALATATLVAAPPLRLRVIGLALLLAATVALRAPAIGEAALMVMEYARAPVALLASVAVTVKLKVPVAEGVPLNVPLALRLKPVGTLPLVMA